MSDKDPLGKKEHSNAFGLITLTKPHGGGRWLFGSRVKHSTTVTLKLSSASINRHLHKDWTYAEDVLFEVEMSAGQWAQLVSSFGDGGGTPVTIRTRRNMDGTYVRCDEIEPKDSDAEVHKEEINENLEEARQEVKILLKQFDAVVEKPGKKALAEFRHEMSTRLGNILLNLPFVGESMKKQMDATVQDAKIEVEAFARQRIESLGFQALAVQQQALENTTSDTFVPPELPS